MIETVTLPLHRRLRRVTEDMATRLALRARLQDAELRARPAWDVVDILTSRFAKVRDKHRPHFLPAHRFRILDKPFGFAYLDPANRRYPILEAAA